MSRHLWGNLFNKPQDTILHNSTYQYLINDYAYLNRNLKIRNPIIFAGDSITQRFHVHEFFPKLPVINRGIYSDTTLGLYNRIKQTIDIVNHEKVFLMIGYNDLKFRTNKEIIQNISGIINAMNHEKLYIQSILPVANYKKVENQRIIELNKMLQILCKNKNIVFIDLYSAFKDARGGVNPRLTIDGIHPNYFGYRLWAGIIKKYLHGTDLILHEPVPQQGIK